MSIVKLQGIKEIQENVYYEYDTDSEILGEGGLGRVYLGKRVDATGGESKVAIKVLHEGLNEKVIERAKREASIQIHNDSLVYMYSFIETKPKEWSSLLCMNQYIISEYLEGISLTDFIIGRLEDKKGIINPNIKRHYEEYVHDKETKSTQIIKCILSGLMALHDKGYIHRDIDPSNIMVTTDGKFKLIDFGLAKPVSVLTSMDTGLTSAGQFVGKIGYAAPELVLGEVRLQNFSTDVYAVGMLYYELITGKLPFVGTSYDLMQAQLHKNVSLKGINSKQVREVIKKATAKKQSERYSTTAQFRVALDNFVSPEKRRMKRWVRFSIVLLCLLIIAVPVTLFVVPNVDLDKIKFEIAMYFMDSSDSKKALFAFNEILELANEDYLPAVSEVAYTYAPIKKSLDRKKLLGFEVDETNMLADSVKNEEAIVWLNKAINLSDSTDYNAMSGLSIYYANGKVLEKSYAKAEELLVKSIPIAEEKNDNAYAKSLTKSLEVIKPFADKEKEKQKTKK